MQVKGGSFPLGRILVQDTVQCVQIQKAVQARNMTTINIEKQYHKTSHYMTNLRDNIEFFKKV